MGNFTKAAEVLDCSQSTVSQAIMALEKELDCRILKRSKGKTELTPEGKTLFPFIEKLCLDYENMISVSSSSFKRGDRGLKTEILFDVPLYLITRDLETVSLTGQALISMLRRVFGKKSPYIP